MNNIKICHLTSAHDSNDVRIFQKECVSLAKEGYNVYLIAPGISRIEKKVNVIGMGTWPLSRCKRMMIMSKKVFKEALLVDAEVYHLHDIELIPYGNKLKKFGKKVIFDAHENYQELLLEKQYIPLILRKIVQKKFNKFYNKSVRKFDALVGVTPNIHENLKKINNNSVIITNYPIIDENSFYAKREDNETIICFAGGISKQWCHQKIIKAINSIDDVRYKLIGSGDSEYIKQLLKEDVNNRTKYLGKISFEKVKVELSESSIGIALLKYGRNTFYNEGTLGNTKIFEEMYAGLPVICTNFNLWKKIITKYNCGIAINPESVEELVNAILYLKNNPEMARIMGENGKYAVESEYNWKTQELKLYDLYQGIVDSGEKNVQI